MLCCRTPTNSPPIDVDQHDQDAGNRVATDELRGAVHGTEKVRFLRDRRAALARLVLADQAGVEIGIDGHLLARHGVEGEARGHFGDPSGTLGDDHEVDDHQDREHHQSNSIVATDQEVSEGFNHLPGGAGPGMPFKQHDPRRGDVERQAQQRGNQQHGRKDREIQRLHHAHGDQHDDHRNGDVEGEKEIQQKAAAARPSSPGSTGSAPARPVAAGRKRTKRSCSTTLASAIGPLREEVVRNLDRARRQWIAATVLAPVAQLIEIGQHLGNRRVKR
jgi:hypothetical protein